MTETTTRYLARRRQEEMSEEEFTMFTIDGEEWGIRTEFLMNWVKRQVEDVKEKKDKEDETHRILTDDVFFNEYYEQNKIGQYSNKICNKIAPIVRASVYGDGWYGNYQEIEGGFGADFRRPVLMRGSKFVMNKKGYYKGSASLNIRDKYLKLIKYTCNNRKKYLEVLGEIAAKLRDKGWTTTNMFFDDKCPAQEVGLWFKGEWIDAHDDEEKYLDILRQVDERNAKKIDSSKRYEKLLKEREDRKKRREKLSDERFAQRKQVTDKLIEENRRKKAKQIAALELIEEMKNASHIA